MIALLLALSVNAGPCVYSREGDVLYIRCRAPDAGSNACSPSLEGAVAAEGARLAAAYEGRGTVGYADVEGQTVSWRITTPMGEKDIAVFVTFSKNAAGLWCPGPRTENEL